MAPALPTPDSPEAPKYWMNETGGLLRPAIENYLHGRSMTVRDLALMRAYFRQWINSPVWQMNPAATAASRARLEQLRADVDGILSRLDIERWLKRAFDEGMDPL